MPSPRPAARGRPRGFDEDEALEAAMLTFWEKGYRSTSIDDLVTRTGASRATIYRTFGDKRDVFIRTLERYGDHAEARCAAALADGRSMQETACALLTQSAERLAGRTAAPGGCLRCATTLELAGSDPVIDAALESANRRYERLMGRIVDRGIERGEIAPDERDRLATFLAGAVAGMVALARSGIGRDGLIGFVDMTVRALTAR